VGTDTVNRAARSRPEKHRATNWHRAIAMSLLFGTFAVAAGAQPSVDYAAIIAAPDRSDADRQTDQRRDPVKLLAFTGIIPGMKVLDMGAGGGYSTELVARTVGATGKVFAQDNARRERFEARAKTPAMANVTYLVRPFDDPVPPELRDVDIITYFFAYHDTAHMAIDRARMNKQLFEALKPGGVLVIADHAARDGAGTSVTNTLHRIEESSVKAELAAAGFKLVGEADFLRNPDDPRDAVVFRSPIRVDEFVLKFQRP
jgi:predicted methyltransferase